MGVHVTAEGAIVSRGPVPMHPRLVQCGSGTSGGGRGKSTTFGESTSGKLSDFEYESCRPVSVVPGDGAEVWGVYI
jgi:hypothetical protein